MRKRIIMALCAISIFAASCTKQNADQDQRVNIFLTGPSGLTQCSDGQNNDPDEDTLIDAADPGCHWDNNAGNPASYDPFDNSERNGPGGPTPPIVGNRPGEFNLFGTCVGTRARLSWTHSDRADGAFIERRLWSSGPWVRLSKFYSVSERTNVEVDADPSAANYWRVVAVNAAGETYSRSPEERDDKTATFACGPPATSTPPPPTGTTPPGTTTPPAGGSCSGASANLPPSGTYAKGQLGFVINAPSGCTWSLTSDNHAKVSTNPAQGSGFAQGSVSFLNTGSATICFKAGGVQISCSSYTVP